ncbi:MAG: OmpL47-type beta-barrel domain-containing protein [Promethearchaeota archaeon]
MNKIHHNIKREIIIISILLFVISINFTLILPFLNQSNSSNKIQEKNSEFNDLKFSGQEINITTPENITYTTPMSGYYPATYGFENEPDGTSRTSIDFIYNVSIAGTCQIDASQGTHSKVLYTLDSSTSVGMNFGHHIDNPQTSGTLEVWVYISDTYLGNDRIIIRSKDNADTNFGFQLTFEDSLFQDAQGNTAPMAYNEWYHLKIIFNCTAGINGQYDWYINGNLKYSNVEMVDSCTDVSNIYLRGHSATQGRAYWDAFGFSWDPNYNIGDNLNEGLLLSFDTYPNLNWIGYSLDGQANKTILGNTTIPMPNDGLHSIQVSGNNTGGTMYQSEMRYFSIDTHAPTSMILFTPYSGMNQVIKSTKFNLTANDGLGSGVSVIRYKINNSGWIDYSSSFNLSNYDYGYYMIYYYSVDVVGHIESENTLLVELIEEPSEPIISGYITMLLITSICIAAIITIKKRLKNNF